MASVKMKAADLAAGLKRVRASITAKASIPILSHVKITASGDDLYLTGNDLDMETTAAIPLEKGGAMSVAVPFVTLSALAAKLGKTADVEISQNGRMIVVKSGKLEVKLQTLPASDFPSFELGNMDARFEISPADLLYLFGKSIGSASSEPTRYYLNGVYLHPIEIEGVANLRAVATDGHRLASISIPAPSGAESFTGIIVPTKTVTAALGLCDIGKPISVQVSPTKIVFEVDGVTIASKLVDGTFPDYRRVIPSSSNSCAKMEKAALAKAVERVVTVNEEKTRAVKMVFSEGKLDLSANSDIGSGAEDLDIDYGAFDLTIGFNGRYVADLLAQISSENLEMDLTDPGSPVVVRPAGDARALYVLMPMRV